MQIIPITTLKSIFNARVENTKAFKSFKKIQFDDKHASPVYFEYTNDLQNAILDYARFKNLNIDLEGLKSHLVEHNPISGATETGTIYKDVINYQNLLLAEKQIEQDRKQKANEKKQNEVDLELANTGVNMPFETRYKFVLDYYNTVAIPAQMICSLLASWFVVLSVHPILQAKLGRNACCIVAIAIFLLLFACLFLLKYKGEYSFFSRFYFEKNKKAKCLFLLFFCLIFVSTETLQVMGFGESVGEITKQPVFTKTTNCQPLQNKLDSLTIQTSRFTKSTETNNTIQNNLNQLISYYQTQINECQTRQKQEELEIQTSSEKSVFWFRFVSIITTILLFCIYAIKCWYLKKTSNIRNRVV